MSKFRGYHKVTPEHLARKAVVYLRQSSMRQVRENLESQRLQYSLADDARAMGFREVEIIDADLGSSASVGASEREGFDQLLGWVARGEIGMVIGREVSRLLRTDKDFCRLVEVCQMFDTLIADEGQIFDPSSVDDQMVLGIKGTMSVVELNTLKIRLLDGQRKKAERGELVRLLPAGYSRDATGKVVKDANERVQEVMNLIFHKFRELWTIHQTFKWFHDEQIEVPVHKYVGGQFRVIWQLPTQPFIGSVLRHPFYAGAYSDGRRPTEVVFEDGKLKKRQGRFRDPEECRVFIRDHHEGYISWETFEENRRLIRRNNWNLETDESVAAVREGQGLLVGLLRCRRCGRKLYIRYWGRKGTSGRYTCKGDYDSGGEYCLAFSSRTVDQRFSEELLRVISPLGVQASLEAIERLCERRDDRHRALERQLQQIEYETQRAFEQYDEVDPRNRLVASELERRWNEKLKEVEQLRSTLADLQREAPVLSVEDRDKLKALGRHFSEVWNSEHCPMQLRKKIVRTVIEEVIADIDEEGKKIRLILHWKGETHTELEMDKPEAKTVHRTSMEALEVIRAMAPRYGDDQIASVLNQQGHRTGKGKRWNQSRVATARRNHSIRGQRRGRPDPEIVSLYGAARHCGVSEGTIKRLVQSGLLNQGQVVPYAPWEIRRQDLDSEPVRRILQRLRQTGKLMLQGGRTENQKTLFTENKGVGNAR